MVSAALEKSVKIRLLHALTVESRIIHQYNKRYFSRKNPDKGKPRYDEHIYPGPSFYPGSTVIYKDIPLQGPKLYGKHNNEISRLLHVSSLEI